MNDESTAAVKEPKKRGKRKQSSYLVLKAMDTGEDALIEGQAYRAVTEGASVKTCIKSVEAGKIVGKLLIVCVRRRLTSEIQETLKLS